MAVSAVAAANPCAAVPGEAGCVDVDTDDEGINDQPDVLEVDVDIGAELEVAEEDLEPRKDVGDASADDGGEDVDVGIGGDDEERTEEDEEERKEGMASHMEGTKYLSLACLELRDRLQGEVSSGQLERAVRGPSRSKGRILATSVILTI